MEEYKSSQKSFLGPWWIPIRKWFYAAWLCYEISIRFYDYGIAVYNYLITQQEMLGTTTAHIIAISGGISTFIVCSFCLTIPACYTIFKFFDSHNPTFHPLIYKIKTYL